MNLNSNLSLRLTSVSALAMLSTGALAAERDVPSAGAQAESGIGAGLEEVVVTAQRREERSQDVPISITAFSPDRLQQQGITQAQDLQSTVPSLLVSPNGQGSRETQSFTIRGQGATFQASPGVVVYLNEVPLPAPLTLSQQGGPGNFVDLESLQVLNGPQGTLFGRNATGGAVLLVPRRPTNELSGYAQSRMGNYDRREVEGALNVPVIDDKLLIRAVGAFQDADGYTHDVAWNKDRDDTHWYSGRLGITFRPTDSFENYTMAYGANSRTNGAGLIHRGFNIPGLQAFGFCYEGPTIPNARASCDVYRAATDNANRLGPRRTAFDVDTRQETKTWGVTNSSDLELSDVLTLRNIISYHQMRVHYRYDGDATVLQQHDVVPTELPAPGQITLPGDGTPVTYINATGPAELPRDDLKLFTEELQLQGRALDDGLDYTVGAFYYDQRPDGEQSGNSVVFCPAALTGLCPPTVNGSYGVTQISKAAYGQASFDLGALSTAFEALKLTAGYRYTWDTVRGFATQASRSRTLPGAFQCTTDGRVVGNPLDCRIEAELETGAPTWTVGLDYRASPDLLLYGKASRGYKSGGFNQQAVFVNRLTFEPEFVTSYEAGFKSDFSIGDIPTVFNAAAFYSDYSDVQRSSADVNPTTGGAGAQILNASARIQGIELQTSVEPFPGIEIGGNFSYTDAEYKKFEFVTNSPKLDCSGGTVPRGGTVVLSCQPFENIAPYIYSVYASAEHALGGDTGTLKFYVSYSHTSSRHTQATVINTLQPGEKLEGFGLLNASLDLRNIAGSGLDAGLFVTNATNELYRISNSNVFDGSSLLYLASLYGEPRMYGLRLKYAFGD